MKTVSLAVALLGFAAAAQTEAPKFDAVIFVQGKEPDISLLYVVLTQPKADHDRLNELVVRHAKVAIQVASEHKFEGATKPDEKPKYKGNVVFVVRASTNARAGRLTGFSLKQLREIAAANPEKGKMLVSEHAWGLGRIPDGK